MEIFDGIWSWVKWEVFCFDGVSEYIKKKILYVKYCTFIFSWKFLIHKF